MSDKTAVTAAGTKDQTQSSRVAPARNKLLMNSGGLAMMGGAGQTPNLSEVAPQRQESMSLLSMNP